MAPELDAASCKQQRRSVDFAAASLDLAVALREATGKDMFLVRSPTFVIHLLSESNRERHVSIKSDERVRTCLQVFLTSSVEVS